jgi:hypothetical protein
VAQLENFRLKVFRAVAEQLSFHKAAKQLFLTQPAVTLQIKAVEDELGMRLFDRAGGTFPLPARAPSFSVTPRNLQPSHLKPNKSWLRHKASWRETWKSEFPPQSPSTYFRD